MYIEFYVCVLTNTIKKYFLTHALFDPSISRNYIFHNLNERHENRITIHIRQQMRRRLQ